MTRRSRGTREERARTAARLRQEDGDTRPFMVILKQERDRLGIIPALERSRRRVETVRTDLL